MPGVKKDFVWDGPCNKREMAFFMAPHTDSDKHLFYKTSAYPSPCEVP